jgi:hypothetical protein
MRVPPLAHQQKSVDANRIRDSLKFKLLHILLGNVLNVLTFVGKVARSAPFSTKTKSFTALPFTK